MNSGWRRECAMGLSSAHLQFTTGDAALTEGTIAAWCALQSRAAKVGFDLVIASGWRSYERQLEIINGKMSGQRTVTDESGTPIKRSDYADWQWLEKILRFSALPGLSRHHWGTELDVFDRRALPEGYQLQLTPSEYSSGGVQGDLADWLGGLVAADNAEGFYMPYSEDAGGVAPEPWHLSCRKEAKRFASAVDRERLVALWSGAHGHPTLVMQSTVTHHIDDIWRRFVVF